MYTRENSSPLRRCALAVCCVALGLTGVRADGAGQINGFVRSWETGLKPYDVAVSTDGSVWWTVDDGVFTFDPVTGLPTHVAEPSPPAGQELQNIAAAADGSLWITDHGAERLLRFDPRTTGFTAYALPDAMFDLPAAPFGVTVAPDGWVWFTCWYGSRLGRFNPSTATFERFEPAGGFPGLPIEIAFTSDGTAWVTMTIHGGAPGLFRQGLTPTDSESWTSPYAGAMTPYGIKVIDDIVYFADHSANKIVRFDPTTEAFTTYDAPADLVDFHFLALGQDNRLYTAGFASASIGAFDPETALWTTHALDSADAYPMGIAAAPNGHIWWAEDGGGSTYGGVGRVAPFGPAALVVGVPHEDSDLWTNSGVVEEIFGSTGGLTADRDRVWHEDMGGAKGSVEGWDWFGHALTWGDYDGNGAADLAVGVPGQQVGNAETAGTVHLFYGQPLQGITTLDDEVWHQGVATIDGAVEQGDSFGQALATGDFNGDGYDDLAVGVPYDDIVVLDDDAGCVNVIYGSAAGLTDAGNQILYQQLASVEGVSEDNDRFGSALATGDFNRDGYDDLAVGVPGDNTAAIDAGAVAVFFGTGSGLSTATDQLWHQGIPSLDDGSRSGEFFGSALAVGDFDGNGWDDLAIGVPFERVERGGVPYAGAGAVNVLYSSSNGLGSSTQLWHQETQDVLGTAEENDLFGSSLAAGDVDADGYDDLAIGIPQDNPAGKDDAGAVTLLYGSSSRLVSTGNIFLYQDLGALSGTGDAGDQFGRSLTIGDLDDDGCDDLSIGVPFKDVKAVADAGSVSVVYGSTSGLTAVGNQEWSQATTGIEDQPEVEDNFGEVIIAFPTASGFIFSDDFESADLNAWSTVVP